MAETDSYSSGGLAAARVAELAASLAAAVADQSRAGWGGAGGARAQAQALGRRAAELGERGAGAYAAAKRALARRENETVELADTQAERDWRLGVAIEQAAEAPLELAARAADIAVLAAEVARRAADDIRADAVVAAVLAAAAARAAARLVEINLAVGAQAPAAIAREYADAADGAAAAAEALDS